MLTPQESREFDRVAVQQYGIPGVVLMENAGRGCAETLAWHGPQWQGNRQAAVILCGPGNNGGDGFVIARHLWNYGWRVRVVTTYDPNSYSGDAKTMLHPLLHLPIEVMHYQAGISEQLRENIVSTVGRMPATWIVDALLGTGATGELRSPMDELVATSNSVKARRLAVDIPSGIDAESGTAGSVVFRADITCTFIEGKSGFENLAALPFLGMVKVIEIGLAARAIL